jgi:site-specific DNA-adenine methylase
MWEARLPDTLFGGESEEDRGVDIGEGKSLRPPVKWHGGKYYLCSRIIGHFPPHHTYVEPFGGAASVLLNKPPSPVEVYNDLDERITRLFRVLRDHGEELHRRLTLTPYSEIEFERANEPATDQIERSRMLIPSFRTGAFAAGRPEVS